MWEYMKNALTPNQNSICLRVSSAQCLLRGAQESSGRNGNLNHINEKNTTAKEKTQKSETSDL